MSFLGDLWQRMSGGGQAANPGAAMPAAAAPAAMPVAAPRSAVDRRTMEFSGPFVPGQPMPTARPDPYAVAMPGTIDRGPVATPIPGMPDPDAMGTPPWGARQMSDAAILAWYQNMHASYVGNMQTMPQMAPAARQFDPYASTGAMAGPQPTGYSQTMPQVALPPTGYSQTMPQMLPREEAVGVTRTESGAARSPEVRAARGANRPRRSEKGAG